MHKIVIYLMNKKGLEVLNKIIEKYSSQIIEHVVLSKDLTVKNDYYDEIMRVCIEQRLKYFIKDEDIPNFEGYKFAVGWRWIIADYKKLIVLHDSILPKYRGFSPLVNMLINGEKEIGVTALFAEQDYDKGKIISQSKIAIQYPVKIAQAIEIISKLYQETICDVIDKIQNDIMIEGILQNESIATYSVWRDEDDYYIDWTKDSAFIKRCVDALGFPFNGARTKIKDDIIIVDEVEIIKDVEIENRDVGVGKVIFFQDGYPVIICGKGLLKIIKARTNDGEHFLSIMKFRTKFGGNR